MSRSWTDAQMQAIETKGTNLLVAAGAGSGKTAVLIERIIGRIMDTENPVDVDNLLVVTYTNAASGEMRQRLGKAIYEGLTKDPDNSHLRRQLALLQRAQVTTLHSFCLDMITKYFYLLDLDPKARIGSTPELATLQAKVLDDLFEEYYEITPSPLKLLLSHYNRGVGDENLRSLILQVANFSYSMPKPLEWISSLNRPYTEGSIELWLNYMAEAVAEDIKGLTQLIDKAKAYCEDATNNLSKYLPIVTAEAEALVEILAEKYSGWDNFIAKVNKIEFARLPSITAKDEADEDIKKRVQTLRTSVKDGIKKIQTSYMVHNAEELTKQVAKLAPMACALVELAEVYSKNWQAAKMKKKLLEFNDLEHYCLALLSDESNTVAADLQNQFVEIFIDEYQDVNQVQEAILLALSRGDNRFMVGDIKQSIYRFRLAEPSLFMGKFADYGTGNGGKRIDLQHNFRSDMGIIDGVNFIFRQLMVGAGTEINYDDKAALLVGKADTAKEPTELYILTDKTSNTDDEENTEENLATAQKEARVIGERIKTLIADGAKYSDIVILLRSSRSWSVIMAKELSAMGIPTLSDGVDNYYESAEIQTMLSLLRVLDNPRQDIDLAALLHSPIVGFSLEELADLKAENRAGELYDALVTSKNQNAIAFNQHLDVWRQKIKQESISEFLGQIYRETGFYQLVGALGDGEIRQHNLLGLQNQAREYESANYKGLLHFIHYMERNIEQGQVPTAVKNSSNAITIMSIHRSKGLEFPIVFVAGLGRHFNLTDINSDVLLHRDLGLGLRCVDLDKNIKYSTLSHQALAHKVKGESLAEELRILYVAMTRAKERLILVGTARGLAKAIDRGVALMDLPEWQLPPGVIKQCGSYLELLILALMRHPDGSELTKWIGLAHEEWNSLFLSDSSKWLVNVVTSIASDSEAEVAELNGCGWQEFLAGKAIKNIAKDEKLEQDLAWQYPYSIAAKTPVKWSVTSLNKQKQDSLDTAKNYTIQDESRYTLAKVAAIDYARRGIILHYLLEHIDFKISDVKGQIEALLLGIPDAAEQLLTGDVEAVADFFTSPVGERLKGATEVLREVDFIYALSANNIDSALAGEDKVLVQGTIDLAFKEASGWIIVDYKSGQNVGKSDDELLAMYGKQLKLYAEAFSKITKEPAYEVMLYFLGSNRIVSLK